MSRFTSVGVDLYVAGLFIAFDVLKKFWDVFSELRVLLQGFVRALGSRASNSRGKIPCSPVTFDGVLRKAQRNAKISPKRKYVQFYE